MVDETLLGEIFGAFGQLQTCKIVRDSAGVHGYCDFADYTSARYLSSSLLDCESCARDASMVLCIFFQRQGRCRERIEL